MSEDAKAARGQFFTVNKRVQEAMLDLIETDQKGSFLEPSSGEGHLVAALENAHYANITSVEYDPNLAVISNSQPIRASFFDFAATQTKTYDCIFGNPPFVGWKSLEKEQTENPNLAEIKERYSDKANLYYLFIDKAIDLLSHDGELIFIVPKEWLYTSSASPLRDKILETGNLTHIIDCGEEKLFPDADVPAIVIFRYQKTGTPQGRTKYALTLNAALNNEWEDRIVTKTGDRLIILDPLTSATIENWGTLNDYLSVKVGIVSGADPIFRVTDPTSYEPETVTQYLTTKGLEWFIDVNHIDREEDLPEKTKNYLLAYKAKLISRRISKFDENNWWKYGAIRNKETMLTTADRFYALVKTRSATPFFTNKEAKLFAGGVLGIFAKKELPEGITVEDITELLNTDFYRKLFASMQLTTGNKLSLQPSTLGTLPFPATDKELRTTLDTLLSQKKPAAYR